MAVIALKGCNQIVKLVANIDRAGLFICAMLYVAHYNRQEMQHDHESLIMKSSTLVLKHNNLLTHLTHRAIWM